MKPPLLAFLVSVGIAIPACVLASATETPANVPVELTFSAEKEHPDPFNSLQVDLVVETPVGRSMTVPMFWAGGRTWKARYASTELGVHRWRTVCSDSADANLHDAKGTITVLPYAGENPLYEHGPLEIAENARHFIHRDGTPFLWIGDTCWMGLCKRLAWPDDFQRYAADRVAKGFNVIQIVAGLYPDMPAFDPRGANEAGFPWTEDYARIRPEYFDAADRRIRHLVDRGLVPCVVGAWGYHLPWMGGERLKQHWRYLVARWGAYPVVWCVAGEVNLPYYLTEGFPFDDRDQATRWTAVARSLREVDPYRRPLSIHPTGLGRLSARGAIDDPALLDFDMLQTGHGDLGSLAPTVQTARWTYDALPTMPFLNSEVCYEGILGACDDRIQRLMAWSSLLSGAAGHTYGANGIWQVNRPGRPYGKSPHGGDYGPVPWDEALQLPGSTQVGLAGRILRQLPWTDFKPHLQWAEFEITERPVEWGSWIWSPETDSTVHAAVESRYFRRVFDVPVGLEIRSAILCVGCDDFGEVWLNGQMLGKQRGWNPAGRFTGVEEFLRAGRNVIAIHGRNMPAPVENNPAGLICSLRIDRAGEPALNIVSDDAWRVTRKAADGWIEPDHDASGWQQARVMAAQGAPPWGPAIASANPHLVPYCAGTPDGSVRLIYLPVVEPTVVRELDANSRYTASWIDPRDGTKHAIGEFAPDSNGTWHAPPAPQRRQDWLLRIVSCTLKQ